MTPGTGGPAGHLKRIHFNAPAPGETFEACWQRPRNANEEFSRASSTYCSIPNSSMIYSQAGSL